METARFLMCPPSFFGIDYVINPWMEGQIAGTNLHLASEQWSRLHALLSKESEVNLLSPVSGLPDLVFTANAALIVGEKAVLSSFRCRERQPEAQHFSQWLHDFGFTVSTLPSDLYFECAGDALLDRGQP